jgi:two-component system nitrogen regulation response regulator GlnG
MPGVDGLAFLESLKAKLPALPVVVMSAYTDVASTAGAFRGGAHEFLSKPFDLDDAVALAARALPEPSARRCPPAPKCRRTRVRKSSAARRPCASCSAASAGSHRRRWACSSPAKRHRQGTGGAQRCTASRRARTSPSSRSTPRPFPPSCWSRNCSGTRLAPSPARRGRHIGRFEQADGGTLFLDEIGDMPASLQVRLLRVLAEGEFFRVGGRELIRVDVRVIAATHQDLEARVREGAFRADLLHRLDVVRLQLPPLRERRGDIAPLAQRFPRRRRAPARRTPKRCSRRRSSAWSSTTGRQRARTGKPVLAPGRAGARRQHRPARLAHAVPCRAAAGRRGLERGAAEAARRRARAREPDCTRACARASTRICWKPRSSTAAAIASMPRRRWAWVAIP